MSHIPASAMPHAAPKHHDDETQAEAIGSPATAPDQAPAILSPSPAFEPAPMPVPDAKTPAQPADAAPEPMRGRRVGVALAAGAVALLAVLVTVRVPSFRVLKQPKREG